MNRAQRRAADREGKRLATLGWNDFHEIPAGEVARLAEKNFRSSEPPRRIFQNNLYIVQVHAPVETAWGTCERAMVRRSDSQALRSWRDLQRVKNAVWSPEHWALEVFPRETKKIDDFNIYWLWVFPPELKCPLEWTPGKGLV